MRCGPYVIHAGFLSVLGVERVLQFCSLEKKLVLRIGVLNHRVAPVATPLFCLALAALALTRSRAFLLWRDLDALDNKDVRVTRETCGNPGVTRHVLEESVEYEGRDLKRNVDVPLAASTQGGSCYRRLVGQ